MVEVEPAKPTPPPKPAPKAPPGRPRPPAGRPPPPKRGPPPRSEDSKVTSAPDDSKAQPVPEDSKAGLPPEDSKATPPTEDSKAATPTESPVSEDSKTATPTETPVSEDSKAATPAEAPVSEDSKAATPAEAPVSEDSKTTPPAEAPATDSESAATGDAPATPATAAPVTDGESATPADAADKPTTPAADAPVADSKPTTDDAPVADSATPSGTADKSTTDDASTTDSATLAGEPAAAAPVPEAAESAPSDATPAAEAPVPRDSKPARSAGEPPRPPVPRDSKAADAHIGPEAAEIAADVTPAGEDAETDELVPAADARPGEPNPGDTAMLAIDAVLAPEGEQTDITDEIQELRFFISGRFEDDAQFAYLDLQRRFPGHPALAEFADRFATGAKLESAAAPVMLDDPRPASVPSRGAGAAKVAVLDDDDEDTFLASIFDEPVTRAPGKSAKPRRAVASLDDAADPQTFFDLGTAYREMGLEDDALTQFDLAAKDPRWTARARIMSASLRIQRGEHAQAIDDLNLAIDFATDVDQRSEAGYELGVLYQTLGDTANAIEALSAVAEGYRDRDDRLKTLGG
ncbi:MAG TPA: hypothetical protein VGB85_16915 [Nannocystis sp.]